MPLSERMFCGKYGLQEDQVRLTILFCHNLLGFLYYLLCYIQTIPLWLSPKGNGVLEGSLPALV